MKKYAFFAIPSLIVLIATLVWLLQTPDPTRSSVPIPTIATVPETSIASSQASIEINSPPHSTQEKPVKPEPHDTDIEEAKIVDASTTETTILNNAEEDRPSDPPKQLSDQAVKAYLSDNLDSKVSEWFVKEHVLSKLARAINALEEDKLVSKYRPLNMPQQAFSVQKQGEQLRISEANYDRYTPYILTLETVGETVLIKAFEHYYPELEQAYSSLGVDKGDFRGVTKKALQKLISTPTPSTAPLLSHKSVMYKFEDPELEKLPATHKLMIRMGPENSSRLKALLQKIVDKM